VDKGKITVAVSGLVLLACEASGMENVRACLVSLYEQGFKVHRKVRNSVLIQFQSVYPLRRVTETVGQKQQRCRITGGSQCLSGHWSGPDRSSVGYSKVLLLYLTFLHDRKT
jgi:hypothetical protein